MRPALCHPSIPSVVQIDFNSTRIPLLTDQAPRSLHSSHPTSYHAIMSFHLRNILLSLLGFFVVFVRSDQATSGEAITTRFWDCCKPSCSWNGKGPLTKPVMACDKSDKPLTDTTVGTGCNGGSAYQCSNQQPWAVNDTFSYGFAGIFLTEARTEDRWCCACYQLSFTSDPLKNKTMIIQASNTAYDINTANRFSLAVRSVGPVHMFLPLNPTAGPWRKHYLT